MRVPAGAPSTVWNAQRPNGPSTLASTPQVQRHQTTVPLALLSTSTLQHIFRQAH